jgi:hypothetical protein
VASAACGLALLLALSVVSGLSLPAWLAALLAVLALAAAAAFIRRKARTRHPLIPVRLLRSRPLAFGLAGAACGYLALFGPLVLIPQVLASGPGGTARTGLLLSALPIGFVLAALVGDLLRAREQHGDHARCRRFVRLPGRRAGQHGQGNRHNVRHLADGAGLAPR